MKVIKYNSLYTMNTMSTIQFIHCMNTMKVLHVLKKKKESACSTGDLGLIPGSRRFLGEGNDYPLWYSCPENVKDRGVWPWGCKESDMTEWSALSLFTFIFHSTVCWSRVSTLLLQLSHSRLSSDFWRWALVHFWGVPSAPPPACRAPLQKQTWQLRPPFCQLRSSRFLPS